MSAKQRETAVASLSRIFAPGQVVTHSLGLLTYETDAGLDRGRPDAVLFPNTADDAKRIVEWAQEHDVPLIARGAGTGLSGGAVAERGGVIVEFSRMSRIIEIDEIGGRAIVEPGVVNAVLDDQLRSKGSYFPPDPASGRVATIGGNIAENAGGPHCFKYGVTTNYVTGLDVLRADGRRLRMGGGALDYPEYDFVGVITGSEGTLGIITQASVRLIRRAPAIKTLMVALDSVEAAGKAVSAIIARGLVPATLEMMDRRIIRILEDYTHAGLPVQAEAALIIEVDGYPESLSPQMDEIIAILQKHRAHSLRLAETAEERDQIWYARKSVGGALSRIAPSYYPVDGTVPRSKIAETLAAITQICANLDLSVAYVLHAGDGNLHPHIFIDDPNDRALVARVLRAGEQVMEWCVRQGGSITGEHGVGTEKRNGMPLMYSADEMAAMRDIKEVFDPKGLLNPGKIFPANVPPISAIPIRAILPAPIASGSPRSAGEAASVLSGWISDDSRKTVRIRGGGTKSNLLPPADRTLCTELLAGPLAFKPEDLYVTVGAGTRLIDLQRQLAGEGMWVPLVSPWPAATIGGMVATNSNAPLRMRVGYGGLRDLVLAATIVLPDARVIRVGRPVVKNVAGYDMVKLFVGSHGTLGFISDVTLRITPLPRARASLFAPFEELEPGIHAAVELLRHCLVASAVLLCRGCNVSGVSAPHVLVYTAEGQKEDVATELAQVHATLHAKGITPIVQSELAGSEIWAAWLGVPRTDILVRAGLAPRALPQILPDVARTLREAPFIADIANGQLYVCATYGIQTIQQTIRGAGGYTVVLSAPAHRRGEFNTWDHAPEAIDLMRKLKARWDPHGLLNPGAFLV